MLDRHSLQHASNVLRDGGVIIHPTATVYGLACLAKDDKACSRIRKIKGSSEDKPLLMITDNFDRVHPWIEVKSTMENELMQLETSGLKLTILFNSTLECPRGPLGNSKQIGIRKTRHQLSRTLIELCESPLVSTSANTKGQPAVSKHAALESAIKDAADELIANDHALSGMASTIVRVVDDQVHILRSDDSSIKILNDIFGKENIVTQET